MPVAYARRIGRIAPCAIRPINRMWQNTDVTLHAVSVRVVEMTIYLGVRATRSTPEAVTHARRQRACVSIPQVGLRNFLITPKWSKSTCGIFPLAQNGKSQPAEFFRWPKMAKVSLRNFAVGPKWSKSTCGIFSLGKNTDERAGALRGRPPHRG